MCAFLSVQARIIINEEVSNLNDNTNENLDENVIDENAIDVIDENAIDVIDENDIDVVEEKIEELKPIIVFDEDVSEDVLTEEEQERRFGIPLQPCEEYTEIVIPLHIR